MANTAPGFQLPDSSKPFDRDMFIAFLAAEGNLGSQTITPDLWNDALAKAIKAAAGRANLQKLSYAELDERIERLTREGADEQDTPEWAATHSEWVRRQSS